MLKPDVAVNQQLITEQPSSGLSIKQYCLHKQITISGFYLWRKKIMSA